MSRVRTLDLARGRVTRWWLSTSAQRGQFFGDQLIPNPEQR